jgi:transcriptional regulator GlxA family with amidase domain
LVAEVFADRSYFGLPAFEVLMCAEEPGALVTDIGMTVHIGHGLGRLASADLVVLLPSASFRAKPSDAVIGAVRAAYERGAIVATHCVGSFMLAATGLLDGLSAATHWRFAAEFAERFPAVNVAGDALYVDEGRLLTGAGAAAGLDLYLHLLRREHGAAVAKTVARDMVVAPHRDGGQAQYIESPVPANGDDQRLASVLEWMAANVSAPVAVDDLAARALMSPRTFARRFKAATGATPHAWQLSQRLARAEELLENTALSMEEIASAIGYASATVLREQFVKRRGIPPREYRRAFGVPLKG